MDELTLRLRAALGGNPNSGVLPSGCQIWGRHDDIFRSASAIFNGAIKTHAIILARPRNASEVSKIVIFCREHNLECSVKSGGFGTHGWSVAGHLILDLALLDQVSISLPSTSEQSLQASFEQLRLDRPLTDASSSSDIGESSRHPDAGSSKRAAGDAWSQEGDSRGKKRVDEVEDVDQVHSRSDTLSSVGSKDADGDFEMERSSSSHAKADDGGSTTQSSQRSGSTPGTSASTHDHGKLLRNLSNDGESSQSRASGLSSGGQTPITFPRTTYVNPQPTATKAFPFVTTSYGTASSGASSSSLSNIGQGSLRPSHLALNTHPDPPPYAIVTFGAGANSKSIDAITAASPYGAFHIPTSAFPVGAGQFVSGGFGFLGRKHGLGMDNLVEAEIVLADGRIVWIGENGKNGGDWKDGEDPAEVWWGLRGAGSILGVVTRFRAKAYYVPSVYAGNFIFLFDRSTAPGLLRHVRDCIKGAPRTVYANIILTAGPPGAPAIVVVQLCFSGPRSEGELYVQTIGAWDGGRCLFQDFSERTYERQQLAVEEVLKGSLGRRWFIKSDLLKSLDDNIVDETCARFMEVPDGCTWLFEFTGGGAVGDVKDSCFPTSHREAAFTVAALHQWGHHESIEEDNRCVTTAQKWIDEVIHPNSAGGPLPCFLNSAEEKSVIGVFGEENYARLRALKATIDPTNFFRHASWPHPNAPDDRRQMGEYDQAVELTEAEATSEIITDPSALSYASSEKGKMKERPIKSPRSRGGLLDVLASLDVDRERSIKAVALLQDQSVRSGMGTAAMEAAMEDGPEAQPLTGSTLVEPIIQGGKEQM